MLTVDDFMTAKEPKALCRDRLGTGLFSYVYTTDDDKLAIKQGATLYDGWLRYALWAMANHHKYPGVLKVYALRIEGDSFWALMERAHETQEQIRERDWDEWTQDDWDALRETMAVIKGHNVNEEHSIDIHDENVMKRHDGSVVVVDPLSWPDGDENEISSSTLDVARRLSKTAGTNLKIAA